MALQSALTEALHTRFPDRLDPVDAASATGALIGAITSATISSFAHGESLDQTRTAVHHAIDFALYRMPALAESSGSRNLGYRRD